MNDLETDWRWLREYIECGSQEAFARLVAEHVDMVYSACLRQLRDRHLAEDATQAVFVVLAGKGRGILPATPLAAWLYNAARLVCANVRRVEARRKYHEAQVAVGARQMMPAETNWDEIAVVLDEVMGMLRNGERELLVLRFFQGQSIDEIGRRLDISPKTAQKRLERALNRLRKRLACQGMATSSIALGGVLSVNAVQAAPRELAQSTARAVLNPASLPRNITILANGAITMMNLAKAKLAAIVCTGVILMGGGIALQQASARPEAPATTAPAAANTDPLVQAVLELDGLIQEEKKAGITRFRYVGATAFDLSDVNSCAMAATLELPNAGTVASTTARVGRTSLLGDMRFWDRQGRVLRFTIEDQKDDTGFYQLQFADPVVPKALFQLVMTSKVPASFLPLLLRRDGKLWCFEYRNMTQDCLNYYELILPPSAIFVDCSFQVVSTRSVNGRATVIVRNYTGPQADGSGYLVFLWPERDGTSLADLPGEYRGLREARVVKLAEEYRNKMTAILSGEAYSDQSTPLNAWLTLNSGIVRNDAAQLSAVRYPGGPQRNESDILATWETWRPGLANVDLLTTAAWPEKPKEGYLHTIEVCRRGSLIRTDTYVLIYSKGMWYWLGNQGNHWSRDLSAFEALR